MVRNKGQAFLGTNNNQKKNETLAKLRSPGI